ncbi:MAG: hypothetical protein US34_C0031G0006 [Candidatus Nomurabacteria bacterium GW2011_GWC2_36_9]|nr:MAG: hypothetical protein US34_C0031G0006 [Candidatus Nomurabacteria bacterium GW2011_GWC2_36_9]
MATTKELQKYNSEYDEAKKNFLYYFKPEFDRGYKLFSSYNGDRAAGSPTFSFLKYLHTSRRSSKRPSALPLTLSSRERTVTQ